MNKIISVEKNKIVYLGAWFQRTSLHLKEFFDFISEGYLVEGLDEKKGEELRLVLGLKDINFQHRNDFNILSATGEDLEVSMSEDGIILIQAETAGKIEKTAEKLKDFYAKKFSPALSFLFSRGAPLPKDLGSVKEVFPLYIMGKGMNQEEISKTFSLIGDKAYLKEDKSGIEMYTGNELVIINLNDQEKDMEEHTGQNIIRNIILFREFEKQLSRYLNLHRTIWERISAIKETDSLSLKAFPKIRNEILDYLKTLSFVRARLCQMKDILISRERTIGQEEAKILDDLDLENRFKILSAEQAYIINLWDMTTDYAKGTMNLLDSVINENTQKEISVLQTISFIGVATGFFGMNIAFPWNSEWPTLFKASYIVIGIILLFAIMIQMVLKTNIRNKKIAIK